MHESVFLQWGLGGFLAGIAAASFFIVGSAILWVALGIGALLLIVQDARMRVAGTILAAAVLGAYLTMAYIRTPSVLASHALQQTEIIVAGYADGDVQENGKGMLRYPFRVLAVQNDGHWQPVDERLQAMGPDWIRPRYGQLITMRGKLQLPKDFGDFDYAAYLQKEGIRTTMYYPQYGVPDGFPLTPSQRSAIAVGSMLSAMRLGIAETIAHAVRQPEAAYLAGILVGARGLVDKAWQDAFSRTGTSHILAISGYNITIVAGVLMMALSRLGRRLSFWLSVAGIVVFTLMVGAGSSVVRAAIMGVMALVARAWGRAVQPGPLILLTASVMCVQNPMLLRWDTGFQLSFLALIGIVYIEPLIRPPLERLLHFPVVAGTAATTLAASAAVTPLLVYDFGQLAVYTLPANMLVLPLVPLAMALAAVTAAAGILWPLAGQLVGQIAWVVAAVQLGVIRWFSELPLAAVAVPISGTAMFAVYAALAACLVSYYRRNPVSRGVAK